MSYEIPAELEYKEIIMFGLTFMQLVYALSFIMPIIAVLKSELDYVIQSVIIALLVGMALMFMFFGLTEKLKEVYQYLKLKRKYPKYLETDQKVSVLKIKPINFTIKTDEEKQVIIKTFQKFLNSLNFPIQILIKTEPLKLDEYLNQLQQKSLNKELVAGMKKHISETLSDTVLNKAFYIIIPEKSGLEKKQCIDKLKDLNLKVEEVKLPTEKYYKIETTSSDFKIKQFHTIIAVRGYPRFVESGFLDKVVTSQGYFDISIHIEPDSIEHTMVTLNKELQKQKADLYSAELKGIVSPSLEIKYKDTKSILEQLHKGEEKLFNVSVYVECRASTKEELKDLVAKIQSELNALMMDSKIPVYRMIQGLKSTLPLGIDALGIKRNITSNALSAFFPFTSPFLEIDETGIWLGLNKNNIPVIKDVFKQFNPNGCILASSGSGKSYTAKLIISRYILNGTKVIVIDPQCEYKQLVKHFGGQCVEISRTSETVINPLDLVGHEYPDKRLSLMGLIPVMLGELTESQKSLIDKAISMAYAEKGITIEESTWNNICPMMSDVLDALKKMERGANTFEKVSVKSLMNRVEMYVNGVFCFLNKQTKLDFDNNFVCFDISKMPKLVQPVMMYLILDYVYMKMKEDINRKLLVIDEAWTLLGRAEDSNYIFEIVKTCRKFNLGLLLINQEVEGLLTSKAGKSVLANTSYTFLMKQKPAVIKDIKETFNLSPAEKDYLLTASVGEGLLIIGDEHTELKVVASAEEHKLITTNADELLKYESKSAFKKDVQIKLDLSSDVYRKADLSEDEVKYLIRNGYLEEQCRAIEAKRQEAYLVKKKSRESPQHIFVVWEIVNHIKMYTTKIEKSDTVSADIIFETSTGKFAIEIETGYTFKHNKEVLFEKIKNLTRDFGKNWCFIVTDNDIRKQYRHLGRTYTRMDLSRLMLELFPLSPPQNLAFKALSPSNPANLPARIGHSSTNTEVPKMEQEQPKTEQQTKEYNNQPKLETQICLSKDGKYVIHRTIITDIKPIAYMEKVLGSE
jgi:conjugal transfer ATP-binding protein TraC